MVAFAGIEQRQKPVVAGHRAIQQARGQGIPPAAEGVDHQRQHDLVEPWVKALRAEFHRRIIPYRQRIAQKQRPKFARAAVVEEPGVKIEITAPIFIRLAQVEAAGEVEVELVVERFPQSGIARPVKLRLGPCPFAPQGGRGPVKIKRHGGQIASDQRVCVKENKGFARGQGAEHLDFVAIGVGAAEMLALEGDELCSEVGQRLTQRGVDDARVVVPKRSGLRLGDQQAALELRARMAQGGGKKQRFRGQPALLPHDDDVESLRDTRIACHTWARPFGFRPI